MGCIICNYTAAAVVAWGLPRRMYSAQASRGETEKSERLIRGKNENSDKDGE